MFEKIVVVTRKTRLEELVERFNTVGQARFYLQHAGQDFDEYQREHDTYRRALDALHAQLELGLKVQTIDRSFLPTFLFSDKEVIVTAGQDGLVANTAKYVGAQPLVAFNPDPQRYDGVLLPFARPEAVAVAVRSVLSERARIREVTLAEATLNDGQRLLAFNDLFLGARSHVSARYHLKTKAGEETQSSSGVVISTGAGSTGWLSSMFHMAAGIAALSGQPAPVKPKMRWEDPFLFFVVREPFVSRTSAAELVAGAITAGTELVVSSLMPSGGQLFSDGVEADFVPFNAGAVARIRPAAQRARLVTT